MLGKVKQQGLNIERGFGFIESDGGDYFLHCKSFFGTFDESIAGAEVEFDVESCERGYRAINVRTI